MKFQQGGENFTKMARERLWIDHVPYSAVEEIIMSCFDDDKMSKESQRNMARWILEGRVKFTENENGDLIVAEDDDRTYNQFDLSTDNLLKIIWGLKAQNMKMNRHLGILEAELKETNDAFKKFIDNQKSVVDEMQQVVSEMTTDALKSTKNDPIERLKLYLSTSNSIDNISWNAIFDNANPETQKAFTEFCDTYGIYPTRSIYGDFSWINFNDKKTGDYLTIEDFIERGIVPKSDDKSIGPKVHMNNVPDAPSTKYGFVDPKGEFHPGSWGDHARIAIEIINKNLWEDEYWKFHLTSGKYSPDFLINVKGYVLLHCPSGFGRTEVTRNVSKPLTKAQKEFLYDYLIKDGQSILANQIFSEG